MKPDDKTERIRPVEDREENPSIERERESEAAEVQEPQLRDGLRNCGKSCTVRRRVKPEPTSSVSNSERIAPRAFSCLRGSRLCWRLRSL